MTTTFGLVNIWVQGDMVSRAVLLILLSMSLASWTVLLLKAISLQRYARLSRHTEKFWHAQAYDQGLQMLGSPQDNPFLALAMHGQLAANHLQRRKNTPATELCEKMDFSDWVSRSLGNSIDDTTAQLQSGLAILASTGATSPFVGLFGTVWGIYHALMAISSAGQASIDKVAGPIGEALIMTALGLAVAIPAVLGYNALVRGNKNVVAKLNRMARDLHAYFVTGERVSSKEA